MRDVHCTLDVSSSVELRTTHIEQRGLADLAVVDLTHTFFPGQPHPAAVPDERMRVIDLGTGASATRDKGDLVYASAMTSTSTRASFIRPT
jgi:hypothetical protein